MDGQVWVHIHWIWVRVISASFHYSRVEVRHTLGVSGPLALCIRYMHAHTSEGMCCCFLLLVELCFQVGDLRMYVPACWLEVFV